LAQFEKADLAQKAMKDWPLGILIEPFDVEHAPVARFHENGNPSAPCPLAQKNFDVQTVALVN
jgi:hypothetical protein